MCRKTREEFIERVRKVHGDRYDYSKFIYTGSNIKGIIICKKHGEFLQSPNAHYRHGCQKCSIIKSKLTITQFIKRAGEIHENKYCYSKFVYVGSMTKGIIICKKHGEFLQSPNSHLRGNGCPKCHLGSTEEFIERSKKIHGNTYNYSKFVYVHSLIKGIIICKIHGEFLQTPNSHVHGAGCPKCYGINLSNDEHVEKFKLVHKDKYDYSLVNYINNKTKVKIICKYHGIFLQTPDNHLSNQGCPKCGIENAKRPKTLNNKIFIDQSIKIHGNIYDYSLVDYKNYKTKVKIICKIHNKIFYQTPGSHLSGSGCPICSESNGEKKIRVFLEKNNIKYKHQKIFDTCRNFLTNHKLRYDFYLYDYNLLIEYDGKGHFAITRFKGISLKNATKSYNLIKITDKIKNKYCKDNNIPLLRIKYTKFNDIEKIIKNKINEITKKKS